MITYEILSATNAILHFLLKNYFKFTNLRSTLFPTFSAAIANLDSKMKVNYSFTIRSVMAQT